MEKIAQIESLIQELVETESFHLVEFKISNKLESIQVTISHTDPDKSVSLEDCSLINKKINEKFLTDSRFEALRDYSLEILSPGLGRKLKKNRDFEIFKNKLIDILLINNIKKYSDAVITAFLKEKTEEKILLEEAENIDGKYKKTNNYFSVELENIKAVSLSIFPTCNNIQDNNINNKNIVEISLED